jgi:hypothetical protein
MSHQQRARPGRQIQRNAKYQDVLEREAERLGGVNASERVDRDESIVVKQARDQESDDLPVASELTNSIGKLPRGILDDAARLRDSALVFGDE